MRYPLIGPLSLIWRLEDTMVLLPDEMLETCTYYGPDFPPPFGCTTQHHAQRVEQNFGVFFAFELRS